MTELLQKHKILIEENFKLKLQTFIEDHNVSKLFVLVDDHTNRYCLEIFKQMIALNFEVIKIPAGEIHKNVYTCLDIWQKLSDKGADRKSLMINLGGGVVTDIGGFTASCFRRGIKFIHLPTSLLAMVDAALGGKNGVDLGHLKNQIGIIKLPEMIFIHKQFLQTLPEQEVLSGFAEILKHGLINSSGSNYFKNCLSVKTFSVSEISKLIEESVKIKLEIVEEDINESGLRKVLNYGHTLGHAIESYRMGLSENQHLLHGEAIAIGLILETYLSVRMFDFPENMLKQLKDFVLKHYKHESFNKEDQLKIIDLMRFDKKNDGDRVNFVLLKDIGRPVFDCKVHNDLIFDAFEYYHSV